MKRLVDSYAIWLWLLIIATVVLLGGQAVGFNWPLSPKTAFGRLLVHPVVAAVEVLFAVVLLLLDWSDYRQKKRAMIAVAVVAVGCAIYHLFYYYIGMELILMYGASSFIRKYSRNT
jgi:hypothetical protein